ncbi:lytic transglycosylase domain-containing protein [Phenylobacterium sp.]|uniref:lytic transglycosylase domain-containing protein n=1 Tax=Phenylobacterium sp. TaxID=1871053 RepID=UPI00272F56FD|nr:lytic transglycosylase domain-containing protein [Phenylobacterium sp.]MDP2212467.1 lytic transglycosylase domain-containing protein [Phenylobacterium sp.]
MTTSTRRQVFSLGLGAVSAAVTAGGATRAWAAPQVLNPWDLARYRGVFAAVDRGDFIDAQMQMAELKDRSLAGHVALRQLMHPTAHVSSYQELSGWLADYADLPGAERVYALALKRRPTGAPAPRTPVVTGLDWGRVENAAQRVGGRLNADKGRAARQAFYGGDVTRAYDLAGSAGERWIAGMAAYRMGRYEEAEGFFSAVARDPEEGAWLQSGAGFWAARAAGRESEAERAIAHLRVAAGHPETFYGMIADRRLALGGEEAAPLRLSEQSPKAQLFRASGLGGDSIDIVRFAKSDPRAHRAVALSQLGLALEAGMELRAGLMLARSEAERSRWTTLALALNAPLTSQADRSPARLRATFAYPTPSLEPKWGFTIDKALVYAIVHQESRFNPAAVSPAGAVGLMQLMPEAAARAAGDDKLKQDMSPLFDPAFNLRVGQDYLTWLMERGVGYDLLQIVAAYNGGPGTLQKTVAMVGEQADSLLVIECLPSVETRNYVEKVVAAYWAYRDHFGESSRTLDAAARGARMIDARLDFDGKMTF